LCLKSRFATFLGTITLKEREETMTAGATSGNRFRSWPEILANAASAAGACAHLVSLRTIAWC
jgi:hypothetical protein